MSQVDDSAGSSPDQRPIPESTGPRIGVILGVVLAGIAGAVVFFFQANAITAVGQLAVGGYGLQDHLIKAADALTSGDYEEGAREFELTEVSVNQVRASADSRIVSAFARVPGLTVATTNWRALASAAEGISRSTGELIDLYGDLSGKRGTSKIFQDGAIDMVTLRTVPGRVTNAQTDLRDGRLALKSIQTTTLPGRPLDSVRKRALDEMRPVQAAVDALVDIAPVLPQALGADGTRRYLVAIGNQAEMRASFGAPLSLVMIEFDDGKISIPIRGQTSTELFPPVNAPVRWFGPAMNPFFPANTRFRPFVVTNTHPNLIFSAQEMAGAWEGGGFPRVDGIVALDLTAIAAVLEATGPIDSPAYGSVDANRLGELLLIEAYEDFGQDEAFARQAANQQLLDDLLSRLLSGEDLITVARAIASTAPGRHFQMWMRDEAMQLLAARSQVAGIVADPGIGDWAAVYTQNGNQSKVDVFQQRNVLKQVFLRPDGGAQINQIVTLVNATPPGRPEGAFDRIGYETSWLKNAYIIYAPKAAINKRVEYPFDFTVRPFRGHGRDQLGGGWADDGFGYPFIRVVGWTPPGAETSITVSYEMPPGTFIAGALPGQGDPSNVEVLEYRVQAEPQALFIDPTLTVQVFPPDGWTIASYPGMKVENGAAIVSAVIDGPKRIGVKAVPVAGAS